MKNLKKTTAIILLAIIFAAHGNAFTETIDYVSSTLWTNANEVKVAGEYAYCDFDNGLMILDISEPSNPIPVSQMLLGGNERKISLSGNYLYVANDTFGVQVIDISDPENPQLIEIYETEKKAVGIEIFYGNVFVTTAWIDDVTGDNYCEVLIYEISSLGSLEQIGQFSAFFSLPITDVFVNDNHIFTTYGGSRLIQGYNILFGGLAVFEKDDISNPQMIADYQIHELGFNAVFANDDYAFVSNSGRGLQIFNIQYLSSIFLESETPTQGTAWDISLIDNYAFIADGAFGVQVFDVTDTQSPVLVSNYQNGHYVIKFDIINDLLYTPCYTGIQIIDISDPANVLPAGSYNTPTIVEHVFVSGNTTAVSMENSGLQLINIEDPYNPLLLGQTDVLDRVHATFIDGEFAYVADFVTGFQVFNIADPNFPVHIGSLVLTGETHDLYISSNYAYLASGLSGLRILDISDPEFPELIGNINFQGYAKGVFVSGDYAYVTADVYGLKIIDVSDPSNPIVVSTLNTPDKARQVFVAGDYAYIADGYHGDLLIIDVSNPINPNLVGSFDMQGNSIHDVYVSGEYAYVAAGDIWVINISNPENPYFIDKYTTPSYARNVFVDENNIYVADNSSLMILNLNPGGNLTQSIELKEGYQFVSSKIEVENPDMLVVLENILNQDLDFVRSSSGEILRKIGPNWVNGIGDWITTEGYLFKMFGDETLEITGEELNPITPIDLLTGFQFVSYLPPEVIDAIVAFDDILTDNLDYIRNTNGEVLRKIGPVWVNGIGDAEPGQGYLIKMFADDELIYNIPSMEAKSSVQKKLIKHFVFEGGNAADPVYTMYISGLNIGDEVAAYEGEVMVGSTVIRSENTLDNSLPVFSTLTSQKGYINGNSVKLKVWDKQLQKVVSSTSEFIDEYEGALIERTYPVEDGEFSVINITKLDFNIGVEYNVSIFPNPASHVLNVVANSNIKRIRIINFIGHVVFDNIINDSNITINTSSYESGIYIISVETNNGISIEKIAVR